MALALSKEGQFEWEDFRQNLIKAIAAWEKDACNGNTTWDYNERYTVAFLEVLEQHGILSRANGARHMKPDGTSK